MPATSPCIIRPQARPARCCGWSRPFISKRSLNSPRESKRGAYVRFTRTAYCSSISSASIEYGLDSTFTPASMCCVV